MSWPQQSLNDAHIFVEVYLRGSSALLNASKQEKDTLLPRVVMHFCATYQMHIMHGHYLFCPINYI